MTTKSERAALLGEEGVCRKCWALVTAETVTDTWQGCYGGSDRDVYMLSVSCKNCGYTVTTPTNDAPKEEVPC